MTRLGTCANCGSDIMLVNFDTKNGCRFCIGCGLRGPDAALVDEVEQSFAAAEEPTLVDFSPEEVTRIGAPDPFLVAMARKDQS